MVFQLRQWLVSFAACDTQAVREGEREVRDLIAWREKDERAISLATPYYDVVRQKHGESDEEEEAANEVAVDYLTQFLPLVTGTRTMNRQEAMEVRERSLKVRTATLPLHLQTVIGMATALCDEVACLRATIITCVRLQVCAKPHMRSGCGCSFNCLLLSILVCEAVYEELSVYMDGQPNMTLCFELCCVRLMPHTLVMVQALKERLVERANIIQARHDSETAALVKRQVQHHFTQ